MNISTSLNEKQNTSVQLYKPKEGLEVIVPDVNFLKNKGIYEGNLLFNGELVSMCGISVSYDLGGEYAGLTVIFCNANSVEHQHSFDHIPDGLIYCAEYEPI